MSKQTSEDKVEQAEPGQKRAAQEQAEATGEAGMQDESEAVESEVGESEAEEGKAEQRAQPQDLTLEAALEKLAAAEAEAGQARDDLLRVQAEMQNLRRRTEQDVEKAHKYALERFSGELLGVMDNLERALEAATGHDDPTVKAIHEGVDLTLKSFNDVFRKFGIEAIDPLGEPFDPQLHQAMSVQENAEVEPNTAIAVMQKGYTLHGRVIRPAMVVVSKAAAPDAEGKKPQ